MKKRDTGATCGAQRHRSLISRCHKKEEEKEDQKSAIFQGKGVLIERGSVVEVQLEGKS